MNRGIARRTVFESRADVRYFQSRLARAVRRGDVELHAYCILTTHFHLLVRSPVGRLSEAMRRIQNEFVRWFNRRRKRDGPLFRGRFRSKPVTSLRYRHILVRYIDANAVSAGIVRVAALYPHGSAAAYSRRSGPPWLERSWIEGVVRHSSEFAEYDPDAYAAVFGGNPSPGLARLVELRIAGRFEGGDPLDDLVASTPDGVLAWMRRKAALADGTRPNLPVCDAESVTREVDRARSALGEWSITPFKRKLDAWPQVSAALLRDLAGLPSTQISRRLGRSESHVSRMRARHRVMMSEAEYAERVRSISVRALMSCGVRSQDESHQIRRSR
jgi:REP element-mobilizing transposase RayT